MSGTNLVCVECGRNFLLSYEQQRHYRERRLNLPRHCPECRSRRRYEGQSGMRSLVGPPITWSPPIERIRDDPTLRIIPFPPVPLWRALSRASYYRYVSRFLDLDTSAMWALDLPEFALLMQWIFEQHGLDTYGVNERDGGLELALKNRGRGWDEFARIYVGREDIPANVVGDLRRLEGAHFQKVHLYTLGAFTQAQKRSRNEFPLTLYMVEGEGLGRLLRETQQLYRARLVQQRRAPLGPAPAWQP
jgi:hypothetical protein